MNMVARMMGPRRVVTRRAVLMGAMALALAGCRKEKTAEDWNYEGVAHAKKEEYEKAQLCFGEAIVMEPLFIDAWLNRGHTYMAMNRPYKAAESFAAVLEIDPSNAEARNMKDKALSRMRGESPAEKELRHIMGREMERYLELHEELNRRRREAGLYEIQ